MGQGGMLSTAYICGIVELHGTEQLIFVTITSTKLRKQYEKKFDTLSLHVFEVRFVTLFSW